ncbi:hypothetical protein [uncultured Fusobacterium sp.]|mgnify:CR=1 FL=1|uniref:hypothetical protein n=1 Tax=uncultured Fusobacterium sp. TaxID=159267 RepID=UPI0025FCB309|nr:hypothetical protein [uncultured Fusobacterium sp.]
MKNKERIEEILKGNVESRITSYIYLKKLQQEINYNQFENIKYLDFEKESYKFFKDNELTLNVFDRGKFFEYIKEISSKENKPLFVDNLEIIQNILFVKKEFEEFLKEMQLQKFKGKVIFIFTDIRIMKIQKLLESNYLEKNIVIGV